MRLTALFITCLLATGCVGFKSRFETVTPDGRPLILTWANEGDFHGEYRRVTTYPDGRVEEVHLLVFNAKSSVEGARTDRIVIVTEAAGEAAVKAAPTIGKALLGVSAPKTVPSPAPKAETPTFGPVALLGGPPMHPFARGYDQGTAPLAHIPLP